MMRRCAWCGADLEMDSALPQKEISHGMCRCCAEIVFPRSDTRAFPEPYRGPTDIVSLLSGTPVRVRPASSESRRS
jgi:hypothetical protein